MKVDSAMQIGHSELQNFISISIMKAMEIEYEMATLGQKTGIVIPIQQRVDYLSR